MIILICAQILFHNLSKLISSAVSLNKVIVLLLEKFILQMELAVSALPRAGYQHLVGARDSVGDKSQECLLPTLSSCSNLGN